MALDLLAAASAWAGVIVAVLVAVVNYRTTKRVLETSTRPIIAPYLAYTSGSHYRLAIKNFGASPGTIKELTIDEKLFRLAFGKTVAMSNYPQPFTYLVGTVFPPGYEITADLKPETVREDLIMQHLDRAGDYVLTVSIAYATASGKTYSETYPVNLSALLSAKEAHA